MRSVNKWAGIGVGAVMGVVILVAVVMAGNLEPSGGPTAAGSQMYTLEQIYERLTSGAPGTKITSFTEPSGGVGSTGHTLDEIMGKMPALDDTNGAEPANVTQGKTYWGLTNGNWGLENGTAPVAGIPQTGQTPTVPFPAPAGSDGDLQKGVAWPNPRFTDNNNGTVTDNLTGLIWMKDANCFGVRTWAQALSAANTLAAGYCGVADGSTAGEWRLPNVNELLSLIDWAFSSPALSNAAGTGEWTEGDVFTGVLSDNYWSGTTEAANAGGAWSVYLLNGRVGIGAKVDALHVWPVRGGQ